MILPGQYGAGHQVRLLSGAYNYTKKQSGKSTLEVIWPEHLWEAEGKKAFQDQEESFQYQTDYLLRFMPKRMFDLQHKVVDTKLWENESYHFRSCLFVGSPERQSKTKKIRYDCCKTVKFKNFYERKKGNITLFRDTFINHDNKKIKKVGHHLIKNLHAGKRPLSYNDWGVYIEFLKKYFNVTEIEYRTPISEVMNHLATCEFAIGDSGMWSMHANALRTPKISLVNPKSFARNVRPHINRPDEKQLILQGINDENSLDVANYELEELLNIDLLRNLINKAKEVNANIMYRD